MTNHILHVERPSRIAEEHERERNREEQAQDTQRLVALQFAPEIRDMDRSRLLFCRQDTLRNAIVSAEQEQEADDHVHRHDHEVRARSIWRSIIAEVQLNAEETDILQFLIRRRQLHKQRQERVDEQVADVRFRHAHAGQRRDLFAVARKGGIQGTVRDVYEGIDQCCCQI